MHWEFIDTRCTRAKVFKGWLVQVRQETGYQRNVSYTMAFVPDVHHEWEI